MMNTRWDEIVSYRASAACGDSPACEAESRRAWCRGPGSGFRVQGAGCRVQGAGFRVQGAGFRVQSAGCRVQGSRFKVEG